MINNNCPRLVIIARCSATHLEVVAKRKFTLSVRICVECALGLHCRLGVGHMLRYIHTSVFLPEQIVDCVCALAHACLRIYIWSLNTHCVNACERASVRSQIICPPLFNIVDFVLMHIYCRTSYFVRLLYVHWPECVDIYVAHANIYAPSYY